MKFDFECQYYYQKNQNPTTFGRESLGDIDGRHYRIFGR